MELKTDEIISNPALSAIVNEASASPLLQTQEFDETGTPVELPAPTDYEQEGAGVVEILGLLAPALPNLSKVFAGRGEHYSKLIGAIMEKHGWTLGGLSNFPEGKLLISFAADGVQAYKAAKLDYEFLTGEISEESTEATNIATVESIGLNNKAGKGNVMKPVKEKTDPNSLHTKL